MNKQVKLKLILSLLFIIVYSVFYYLHTNNKNERIKQELNTKLNELKTHYDLSLEYFFNDAKTLEIQLNDDEKFINIFQEAYKSSSDKQDKLRTELYDHFIPFYKRIKKRGFLQFHIVFPNNTTFLRVHKPKKFGDDLSKVRYSYVYVNKYKTAISGFEQGKTVHSIRYVFPVFDKKQRYLGAVELSLSTKYLQEKLIKSNKIHTHYIVNKSIFEAKKWKEPGIAEKYIPSVEHPEYMYTKISHVFSQIIRDQEEQYVAPIKDQISKGIDTKESFSLYAKMPDKDIVKVLSFLPIENIKDNKVVAYIVSHVDSYNIKKTLQDSILIEITVFIGLFVLFFFIYKILHNEQKLKQEVYEKTKKLKELNKNLSKKVKEEVEKSEKAKEKLFKSDKMASMGEMIGNIAHQWRQPLSVISTSATGMKLQKQYNNLSDEEFNRLCDMIDENAQYLSRTIDDFKNFIKGERIKQEFFLNDNINSFLHLVEGTIKSSDIKIIKDLQDDIIVSGYPNELIQCYINLFNNAKDALESIEDEKYIFISTRIEDESLIISFKDNANGISEENLSKIFDPYFTTKHQSQGTGLGLSMVYSLIEEGMNGSVIVENVKYDYLGTEYNGAQFSIKIPLK